MKKKILLLVVSFSLVATLAMAAGVATLNQLAQPGFYEQLDTASDYLFKGLIGAAEKASIPVTAARIGSLMGFFFTSGPVDNLTDAQKSDLDRFGAYYKGMLSKGVYLAPSQFESLFVSTAHSTDDFDLTIGAAEQVFAGLNKT